MFLSAPQEGFHDLLTLGAGKVARLRTRDLEARILLDHFLEALLAVNGRRRANRALQLDDIHIALALVVVKHPLGLLTFFDEVGADHRDVEGRSLVSMLRSVRMTGIFAVLASFEDRVPTRCHNRSKSDDV